MTTIGATLGVWFVTVLWGSWFQTVKHLKNFPVDMFIAIMYALSVCLVWITIIFFGNDTTWQEVLFEFGSDVLRSFIVLMCGFVFGIAMQMHLRIVKKIGLILSTSVSASCAILGGTIVSIVFAGIADGVSVSLILVASILLILATITCQYAGYKCDKEQGKEERHNVKNRMLDVVLLAFINLILMSFYPLANSIGLRTSLNPNGFSSLGCMGLLVIGAFMGALINVVFHHKQHSIGIHQQFGISYRKLFLLAGIAAMCHFGGNLLHAMFAPIISVTIATAIGNSYHLWSYVWGLLYGEFKGASMKTYVILGLGVLMFLVAVLLLSFNTA